MSDCSNVCENLFFSIVIELSTVRDVPRVGLGHVFQGDWLFGSGQKIVDVLVLLLIFIVLHIKISMDICGSGLAGSRKSDLWTWTTLYCNNVYTILFKL